MSDRPSEGVFNMSEKRLRELHLYKELMSPEERRERYILLKMAGASVGRAQRARDWSPPHFQMELDYYCNPDRLAERLENNRLGLSEEGIKSVAVA